jgi:hypothetical protein
MGKQMHCCLIFTNFPKCKWSSQRETPFSYDASSLYGNYLLGSLATQCSEECKRQQKQTAPRIVSHSKVPLDQHHSCIFFLGSSPQNKEARSDWIVAWFYSKFISSHGLWSVLWLIHSFEMRFSTERSLRPRDNVYCRELQITTKVDWYMLSVIVPMLSSALHNVLPTVRYDCTTLLQKRSARKRDWVSRFCNNAGQHLPFMSSQG